MANTKSCESLYVNVILYPLKRYFFVQLCLIQCNGLKSVGELQDSMLGYFPSFYVLVILGNIRNIKLKSTRNSESVAAVGQNYLAMPPESFVYEFIIQTASKCDVG